MDNRLRRTPSGKRKIIYKKLIGEGSFGEVWSVEWGERTAAAKRIHKKFFQVDYDKEIVEERVEKFMAECEILQNLNHDNIVRLLEVRRPENKSPVLIMELMHCDLEHYIKESTSTPKVSPDKAVSIALGIAEGLKYLHELPNPIIHRDLSSKNILLTENGQAKIADLGVAKILLENKEATGSPKPGALLYAAPETCKNVTNFTATYGVRVDIFSFGVVLLEMLVGHKPRVGPSGKTTQIKRRQADLDEMEEGDLKRIVIHCLQEKSRCRPSASKIVTDLGRIKQERERQKERCTQPVSFERLYEQPSLCDHHFKVLLLGNSGVGKSSLFKLLRNPTYDISKMESTVGTIIPEAHYFKYDATSLKMEIADTSGEERYFAVTPSYYRDVDAVFLVYSVVDEVSLQSLKFWKANLKKYNSRDNLQMLLVGNKVDLRQDTDSADLVPQERAKEYASEIQCPYVETSAKDIDSVMMMYCKMAEMLMSVVCPDDDNVQVNETRSTIRLSQSQDQNSARKHNCIPCRTN